MRAQAGGGLVGIACAKRFQHAFVLGQRRCEPVARSQLNAAVGAQALVQGEGLLGQKTVAARPIDRLVE